MADLEGCERMQRPLCWAERRRATAMRLSGGGGGLPLLREVARCASVPPGVGEIVHAVLRLCGVAVTGAAEVDAFAGIHLPPSSHAQQCSNNN